MMSEEIVESELLETIKKLSLKKRELEIERQKVSAVMAELKTIRLVPNHNFNQDGEIVQENWEYPKDGGLGEDMTVSRRKAIYDKFTSEASNYIE